jgi:hypothetical protein
VLLLVALAIVGAAIGAGLGMLLRDGGGGSPSTRAPHTSEPPTGDGVDAALANLEAAIAP